MVGVTVIYLIVSVASLFLFFVSGCR